MSEPVIVPVAVLRRASGILFDHLEAVGGDRVEIDEDYFWSVVGSHVNDPTSAPSDFTLGQVSASLENLAEIIADPEMVVSYGLVWLAEVLQAVGRAVVE